MFIPPLDQIWRLFKFKPYNENTHLVIRFWVRLR